MKQRMYAVSVLFFLVLALGTSVAETDHEATQRKADEDKMLRMEEVMRKQDVEISFYGKVLDQNDVPVEGATVSANITHFSPDKEKLFGASKSIQRITDRQGVFSIEGEKGRSVYIEGISAEGYEYAALLNTRRSFQYCEHGNEKPFISERTSPVIIRLRKQGRIAFCLETKYLDCQILAGESGRTKGYDFVRQVAIRDLTAPVLNGEALTCDLKVKATLNTNTATWAAVLSSGDTNGGIIVSEQFLYEAPETGYQPEYAFTPEDRRPVKAKYVYLKSRDPAIYTRLELNDFNAAKNFFRLNAKSAITNPYGDRNLEQATGLPHEVTKQLADDAKASFRQNKRPSKPDLPKLVKEAKDKQ
jgi:hypothetical protein